MIRIFCSLEVPASPTKTLLPQESGKQLNLAGKRKKTKWRHVTPHRYRVAAMELYKLLAGAWTESHRPPHHLFHKWCPQRIWHHGFGWGGYDIGGPGNVSTLIRTETRSTMERDCIVSKSLLQTLCWQQFGITHRPRYGLLHDPANNLWAMRVKFHLAGLHDLYGFRWHHRILTQTQHKDFRWSKCFRGWWRLTARNNGIKQLHSNNTLLEVRNNWAQDMPGGNFCFFMLGPPICPNFRFREAVAYQLFRSCSQMTQVQHKHSN